MGRRLSRLVWAVDDTDPTITPYAFLSTQPDLELDETRTAASDDGCACGFGSIAVGRFRIDVLWHIIKDAEIA